PSVGDSGKAENDERKKGEEADRVVPVEGAFSAEGASERSFSHRPPKYESGDGSDGEQKGTGGDDPATGFSKCEAAVQVFEFSDESRVFELAADFAGVGIEIGAEAAGVSVFVDFGGEGEVGAFGRVGNFEVNQVQAWRDRKSVV